MKKFIKQSQITQFLPSLIIGVFCVIFTVYVANQQTSGENNQSVKEAVKDIQELKDCSKQKVDKESFNYAIDVLTKRLDRFDQTQTNTDRKIDEIILLLTKK